MVVVVVVVVVAAVCHVQPFFRYTQRLSPSYHTVYIYEDSSRRQVYCVEYGSWSDLRDTPVGAVWGAK